MIFSRINVIFGLVSLTGLGISISSLKGSPFSFLSKKVTRKINDKDRVYKWDCYKWIVGKTLKTSGDLFACNDARIKQSSSSLIFVLWLIPNDSKEYNYPYGVYSEIEKIKLEGDKSLSFTFTSKGNKYASEKFISSRGLYWDVKNQRQYPDLELSKISDKSLKGNCKIEGGYLKCSAYDNFQAPVEADSRKFKLIY